MFTHALPALHGLHEELPDELEYEPSAHAVHVSAPLEE